MFKKIMFLFLFVILVSSTLSAGDVDRTGGFTRISSMGANPFIMDPFNATVNPAWAAYYNNFVFADIGTAVGAPFGPGGTGQFFAGFFSLNKNITLGAFLTRNDFVGFGISRMDPAGALAAGGFGVPGVNLSVVAAVNGLVPGNPAPAFNNNVELMGTFTSKNLTFGFGVAYASQSTETTPPSPGIVSEASSSQIGVNAGILLKGKKLMLDAGVSLILPSASSTPGVTNYSETKASQTIILVNARAFYELSKNVTVIPAATFLTVSGSIDTGGVPNAAGVTAGSGDMPSVTAIGFGIGFQYQVGNFLLAGGPSFYTLGLTTAATSTIPELKQSAFLFPVWNIGMEWNLLDWLVGRMGYVALTGSTTSETPSPSPTDPKAITEAIAPLIVGANRGLTMGVGFRFGDFRLDGYVNEDVLRQGFAIIGGSGNAGGTFRTFFLMTASYALP
jgi:hypothetical protein